MAVTIRSVARQLNISITTVSRALDGYADVAEDTRQLVIETARQMGYVPNRAARQLRRQRTDTIGYILPAQAPQFSDPFFAEFIAGLGDEVALHNYDLLVSTAGPDTEAERLIYERWAHGRKVDGFVLNRLRLHDARIRYLDGQKIPFVSLERSQNPVEFIGIEVEASAGVQKLMAHLIQQGHHRIAFINAAVYVPGDPLKIQVDRFEGYQKGLEQHGLAWDAELVASGDLTAAGGYTAAQKLLTLTAPPTAIVCVNDLTAFGVLHAAHERGLRVGQDLAVAGFDGLADSQHTDPPLTTLDQPVYAIARQLVQMLLAILNGDTLDQHQARLIPELLLRASTIRNPISLEA